MDNKEPKISIVNAILLTLFALGFDVLGALVNLIPAVGQFIALLISGFAYACFWFVFSQVLHIKLFSKKKALKFVGPAVLEFIPFLSFLPGITTSVVLTILSNRAGDVISKIKEEPKRKGMNARKEKLE